VAGEPGRLRRRRSLEYVQYSALRCFLHPARLRSATLGPAIRNRLLANDRAPETHQRDRFRVPRGCKL
jgi:hypothetical protein